jgi:hypothetical protein
MWRQNFALALFRIRAHIRIMAEKHPKRPRDLNQWAKRMVDIATGEANDDQKRSGHPAPRKMKITIRPKDDPLRARTLRVRRKARARRLRRGFLCLNRP